MKNWKKITNHKTLKNEKKQNKNHKPPKNPHNKPIK